MTDPVTERQSMDVDIVCVGFGPAMGGFLTTLAAKLPESGVEPPQVMCYERADDLGFGVSGVVTRARGIRASLPDLDASQIPMAAPVRHEKVLYLLDPIGASRRSGTLKLIDKTLRATGQAKDHAFELPYIPEFLRKDGGLVMSIGQFNQFVGTQLMSSGMVLWPSTPVAKPLLEEGRVAGVRLIDQGVDKAGNPEPGFLPGMDVRAKLTVVGDGPVGIVGRMLDEQFGMPEGHHKREWALGMKMVVDLPEGVDLEPGTVLHTFGFPEPEIFGFFYVHPERVATVGIFVPSWFGSPARTAYRYLQHYVQHPYLWNYLKGARLRSWGAKSLQESGRRGEPLLAGDGYARIGEGSGSTNVLTGSGVDEAWTTGVQLGEAVVELLRSGREFTKANLEATYVKRRRESWVETEGRIAERARDGFHQGVVPGLIGMALAAFSKGTLGLDGHPKLMPSLEQYYIGKIGEDEIARLREQCAAQGGSLHDELMDRCGWPRIECDGQLLVTHQDALLMGGKVQAPPGYADHVSFLVPELCDACGEKICTDICSGQAITVGDGGRPAFDREKCVFCGACLWNCSQMEGSNIQFTAGAGGLHSSEN